MNREDNFTFELLKVSGLIAALVAFAIGADYLLRWLFSALGI